MKNENPNPNGDGGDNSVLESPTRDVPAPNLAMDIPPANEGKKTEPVETKPALGLIGKIFGRGRHKKGCTCGNCEWSRTKETPKAANDFPTPDLSLSPPRETGGELFTDAVADAPIRIEDFAGYGAGGLVLVNGQYRFRTGLLIDDAQLRQIPQEKISVLETKLGDFKVATPDEEPIKEMFSMMAADAGLPSKGGKYAAGISALLNTEMAFRAACREIKSMLLQIPKK